MDNFIDYKNVGTMKISVYCVFVWLFLTSTSMQTAIAFSDSHITTVFSVG